MLSRLSGLANIVIHELSGNNYGQNMTAPLEAASDMELDNSIQEDILQRLADSEKLVVELKDIIKQKDVQLQQKDEVLQEERKAADIKIKKIKLHAKAKFTALNKHVEELKAQGGTASPTEQQAEEQPSKLDKSSAEMEEFVLMKQQLQEKEELINTLQTQLSQTQAEQAAQLDKRSAEMEEFVLMKQQLQEKEELINTLQTQLSQTQAEQAAQLDKRSAEMEEFVLMKQQLQEKEELIKTLQTQLSQTQAEQAAQLDKRSAEMEEFVLMKQQLQEKEELINTLQTQLSQTQAEQAAQLDKSSAEMEEFILMKQQLQKKEELINTLQTQLSQTQAEQAAQLDKRSAEMEEFVLMKQQLQEKEELINTLQTQLSQTQAEQAAQLDKSSAEMEKFFLMKQQLQEKEELINTLQTQLSQTQAEQAAQLDKSSAEMEKFVLMIQEKEELINTLQTQLSKTQAEQAAQLDKSSAEMEKFVLMLQEKEELINTLQTQLSQTQAEQAAQLDKSSAEMEKFVLMLQEKKELINTLQTQLSQTQAEQAAQLDKSSAEMEKFFLMKQQLQEKEELINTLKTQHSQTQAEQAAQLDKSSAEMEKFVLMIQEKEELINTLQTQLSQTQAEQAAQLDKSSAEMEKFVLMIQEKEELINTLQTQLSQTQAEQAAQLDKSSAEMEKFVLMIQEKEELINTLQTQLSQTQAEQAAQLDKSSAEMEKFVLMLQEKKELINTLQTQLSQTQAEQAAQLDKSSAEMEKFFLMKQQLQEKEELINTLKTQHSQTQAEQAAQLDKSSAEMEKFVLMIQEKEELINTLQTQLSQTQAEQAAQLSSMQQVVREKDARFETQVRLHEDELLQLVTQSDVETEMQQKLRVMQRKLEEHEEALLGRAQVVELLQQELTLAEQKNEALSHQLLQLEAENGTLKNTIETERQESKILMEKVELEVAERKLSFHNQQEEMHQLQGKLEQASQAQAELETQYSALEQRHRAEMEEKDAYILSLQKTEQELQSACDALKEENSELLREKSEQAAESARAIEQLEDQLQQKSKEIRQFVDIPNLQKHETASQTSLPDVYNEGTQAVTEENITSLQKRVMELEDEKRALLLCTVELEELKAENEKLSSQITLLETKNRSGETDGAVCEVPDVTQFSKSDSLTKKSGQDDPENTFSQKHKELSVLLVEMTEAQEEIAFLKSQLQGKRSDGNSEVLDQKEVKVLESEGPLSVTAGDSPFMLNEESSVPAAEKEEQDSTKDQPPPSEAGSPNEAAVDLKSSSVPDACQCHQSELESLKTQIFKLETSLHKAEEIHEKNLDEKDKEISSLTELIDELKKKAEDAHSTLTVLSEERDQLLSRIKELDVLAELRAQVQELQSSLAEAEKQRGLDYESQKTQHNLLTEQIHSLSIEAKSKDVKIEALQKELDDVQIQCSQQDTQIKSLQSQLQKKESEVIERAEHVKNISEKVEELSQALSQKELEVARMDQLLVEKKKDVETLQQTIQEKDQQVTELSFSMTEKMVQLNEEKFSLGVEIKTLKEQLNVLSRAEEAKKEQVEESHGVISNHSHDESSPVGLLSKEALQQELELLRKESELRKRKLHAALIHRKELLQKVGTLEEELAKAKEECRKEIAHGESEKRKLEPYRENKDDPEKCETSKCREIEVSLKQTISEKEVELQHIKRDLKERMAAEEELQAVVQQMNQNLQDKTKQIDLLQVEISENQATIQKLTTGAKDAGDSAAPVKETHVSSPPSAGSGEHWTADLEGKTSDLEKEKEQLQKKLQEALTSRKVILKKAQEREKHLKEELGKQKDAYSLLQEQFDKQSKEIENMGNQLRQLQIEARESSDSKLPGTNQWEPGLPIQGFEEVSLEDTEQQPAQPAAEFDLHITQPSCPGDAEALQATVSVAQIKAQLIEMEVEKEELELKVSSTASELTKKSEEVFLLQEQISKQGLEIQTWKTASHEAEAHAEILQHELESSKLKLAGLEHLKTLQHELDELQKHMAQKEEEVSYLSGQLSEKEETLTKVQAEMLEQEHLIKALHTQMDMHAKDYEERLKQSQLELCQLKQKSEQVEDETKAKQQIHRKLQAALISRKEALKENKTLQEELSSARDAVEHLTKSLADVESQISVQNKEKDAFLRKLALLQEERDKLIVEVDRSLLENQSLGGSCESLKLALEGLTEDKEKLMKELESLRCSKMAEITEWQEKHKELQKEYEVLLQSYENVSNEAERIQHVVESVRQEKQELYGKLRSIETDKKETEKQLQDAEHEMEEMKEKMRKFAKSKQQKILELEEENDRLRAEAQPIGGAKESMEALLSSNSSLKEELERVKLEYKTLSKEFEALMAEKDILSEEIQGLKHQVEDGILKQASLEATEKSNEQKEETQAMVGKSQEQDSQSGSVKVEVPEGILSVTSAKPGISETFRSHDDINNYLQQLDQLNGRIAELEMEKQCDRELNRTLENEKNALLSQISAKDGELKLLEEEVAKINTLNQQIQEELSRVTKLKEMAEEEKDDLEERLMNQLAELNGSIGNYYQDVTDAQIKNEQLESEMQNLKKCMSELEEEKQQLVKEKTKVETEIRKEYLEKIQGAQKGAGNKSHAKELQELLKEKQQEVKQLQKDCIRYQEKISALEKTVKALEYVQTESQKDLDVTKGNLAQAVEHHKQAQEELSSFKVLLDDTQSEAARVLADNLRLKKELQSNKEAIKNQMKQKDEDLVRRLEQAEEKFLKEKINMQEKLDALHGEKTRVEDTLAEIQVTVAKKDKEMKQLQESLDSTMAQLAAFTKSMSSLQDDRDRVIDEAKKWEQKFGDAIQTKEKEIRLKEENCMALKDQLHQMSIHTEELKTNISRLEHDKEIWGSKAQTELQHQQKVCDTLQGENKELVSQLEETRQLYHNSMNEVAKLESELKDLKDQSSDLNNSLEKCKDHKEKLEGIIKQQEAEIQNCKFSYEQLETDLKASRELTGRLHDEIHMKEQKIVSLLSGKEEAVQVAVAELCQQHNKEIKELEHLLSQEEEENATLEEDNKKAVEKTNQLMETLENIRKENLEQKAQLNSFFKSMASLQDDRDRIISDYQQLEDRHLSVILEKDQLIQEAAAENNKLKEEIRGLRSHMDDLNSENAKLDAELIQYRQDLNEVIVIKDCQQKQLLDVQLLKNKELKNECAKLEEKLKGSEEARQSLQRSSDALQGDKQCLSTELESLKRQVAALQEEGTLGAQLKDKEEEVQRLNAALSSSQKRAAELEEELVCVQKEATRKVSEIEDKLKKELKHLHHDAGIMRNETETAEERVAELARDLVEMEQKLLMVTKENKDLMAQIQSFGRSMSSLQDSRDHATEELGDLKKKYEAVLKELTQLKEHKELRRESDVLSQAAFPLTTTENSLSHLEKLNQQLISKDEQLLHLSSQLEDCHNKVQSFSKAMTSLQTERDHLWSELEKFRKLEEGKQRAAAPSSPSSPAEMQSLKKAMSSLQNDRDRLLKELKNLQQQYLQMNQEVTNLRPLKAQLQEYQEQTKTLQMMKEKLRQENLNWQQELHQLRMEKDAWELHERQMKEQYIMAVSDKDQQLNHLQSLLRASSQTEILSTQSQRQVSLETSASLDGSQNLIHEAETLRTQLNDTLKENHQKELRIQQLNMRLSQLLEEKNILSIQLSDANQSLRENQHHYGDLFRHCAVLERQVHQLQARGPTNVDVAPGAPQEMSEVCRNSDPEATVEPQPSLAEVCSAQQELGELKKLLEEERDQRLTAENALSLAEEQIRRLQEHSEWDSARTPIIGACGSHETAVLIDLPGSTCRRTRSGAGWKRVLRSLCHSRTRVPLLAAMYLLMVHVLLILCFTGHL
ncbi:golgin subfamily B member 1 isoform X19 [Cricetulus griseus]|uniref:Golgin subfamily B member 1 isoform X19 n=1 Tax=Cricetulus griseus TaxID=10029 RepID=A0A9J7JPE6_CRIGR|nr:golgin subfamily B member 1 isoform X19 [Cricetulus griseus]